MTVHQPMFFFLGIGLLVWLALRPLKPKPTVYRVSLYDPKGVLTTMIIVHEPIDTVMPGGRIKVEVLKP